ncbi:MAG: prepilin peptidase [Rickettsiales bacterium]|jgi:prepilin peptidase CpaA|nr:prepilin peptidase [Rickettsiales bacterium]
MAIISLYFIFSMLAVMVYDVTRYIIPNWLVGSLLVLYPVSLWLSHEAVDWQMALAAMGVVFALGYVVFALRLMGGGDIKLITVCALWVGWSLLLEFIFITAILGGILALSLWLIRKPIPYLRPAKTLPRILKEGEPVPYGVAIALAMLYLQFSAKIALLV